MEKVSYEEAREWFWVRTVLWFVPALIVTAIAYFAYAGDIIEAFKARLIVSLASAFVVTLFGLLAAIVSKQYPWMRLGRWQFWMLNAIVCGVVSALCAIGASGIILTLMQGNVKNPPSRNDFEVARSLMGFGIGAAAVWGLAFGSWFALRFDTYFVESI